jgi:Domain of unknown function (DUF4303)
MKINKLMAASTDVATSICACMNSARSTAPENDPVYGVCLVTSDDYNYLSLNKSRISRFQQSNGGMLAKWYFGEWWSDVTDIDVAPLMEHLGPVNDSDQMPENDNGPYWLAAMTLAMSLANNQNAFSTQNQETFIFCSLVDDSNAVWLENASAQFLNSPDSYQKFGTELSEANKNWYSNKTGRQEYKTAYEILLRQIQNGK